MNITALTNCQHSNHLFESPLCPHQPLLQRIGNIAFHVFTFFIPLMVYHIVNAIFPKGKQIEAWNEETPWIPTEPDRMVEEVPFRLPPYSDVANTAITFARSLLQQRDNIPPEPIITGVPAHLPGLQPLNDEIARLTVLERTEIYPFFESVIRGNPDDTWNNPYVIDAANEYIKVCFAISALTVDDLPRLVESQRQLGEECTTAQLIASRACYVKRTFYAMTKAYHWIRSGIHYNPGTERGFAARLIHPQYPNQEHSEKFYRNESMHFLWNQLYNEFCDRVFRCTTREELERESDLILPWIMNDESMGDFTTNPGPLPA